MPGPDEPLSFTAVLLSGGRSQRMGADKSTLRLGGEPLWSRQLRLLHHLPASKVWISARTAPAWCPPATEVVLDATPSRGPLSGICASLMRLDTTHLIVVAIDMPRMTPEHLLKLATRAHPCRSVLPRHGDLFEPLCAIYAKSAAVHATAALEHSDASLQQLCRSLQAADLADMYLLAPAERPLYFNLNRPEDLSTL